MNELGDDEQQDQGMGSGLWLCHVKGGFVYGVFQLHFCQAGVGGEGDKSANMEPMAWIQ